MEQDCVVLVAAISIVSMEPLVWEGPKHRGLFIEFAVEEQLMEGNPRRSLGYDPGTEIVHGLHQVYDGAKMASDHQSG